MERRRSGGRRLLCPRLTVTTVHPADRLPAVTAALAVIAHPDDESFGLGAVLGALVDAGTQVAGICFTHGEASTLGPAGADLPELRAFELAEAARALGIVPVELLEYADGRLACTPVAELADRVVEAARCHHAELLVVFDEGGITGHRDHQAATEAALTAARRLAIPVVAWAVSETVADALNAEFGSSFVGRPPDQIDITLTVERTRQLEAIARHRSQSGTNPVLWRRLQLSGDRESLRWLSADRPGDATDAHGRVARVAELDASNRMN